MLSNKVNEIMTPRLNSTPGSKTIFETLQVMDAADVGRVIITDNDAPIGIFTEKDVLRRVVNKPIDPRKTSIRTVMTSPIQAVREDTLIVNALRRMFKGKFRHLLVRNEKDLIVGIVSMRRILKLAVELDQGQTEARTVGSIMSEKVITADGSQSVYATIELMVENGLGSVVITEAGKPTGIFTERDVLKRVATRELDTRKTAICEIMTKPLQTMPSATPVGEVLAEMYRRDIRNMVISHDKGGLAGIITMPDVLKYAGAFNIDEKVRQSWKEVAEFWESEDQYTPG